MGFRTVIVKNRSKLDLKMNYLVCRSQEITKVFIPEISTLILESTAISLTSALVSELIKNNVKIIFCDEKHNPESELVPYHNNYNSVKKIREQLDWKDSTKEKIWAQIVKAKIINQAKFLKDLNKATESNLLISYSNQIYDNDLTNREGHAAKVYFNTLFGLDFSRRTERNINSMLNYGYSIIMSCFNRELTRLGYLTQLGIWHKNEFNPFNLACDLMEPFRTIVDRKALSIKEDINFRIPILEILNEKVKIDGKLQTLENAIAIYCQSVIDALNCNKESLIKFYE